MSEIAAGPSDRVEKIRPEFADILAVGIVELLGIVQRRAAVARIKCPASPDPEVKGALRAVEVRAGHIAFLRVVPAKKQRLPRHRKLLKRVMHHLVIRRNAGLFLRCQHRFSFDRTATGRVHPARPFFPGDPQHLVKPVHPDVAERAVGVIEILPVPARVDAPRARPLIRPARIAAVERPQRRRTAPQVPIEPGGTVAWAAAPPTAPPELR